MGRRRVRPCKDPALRVACPAPSARHLPSGSLQCGSDSLAPRLCYTLTLEPVWGEAPEACLAEEGFQLGEGEEAASGATTHGAAYSSCWGFWPQLSVTALAFPQPQLRLLLPGYVRRVLRHRGPGHVDPTLSAPRPSCAEDSRAMQQPALWGQGQVGLAQPGPGVVGNTGQEGASLPQPCPPQLMATVLRPHSLIFGAITCFTGFLGVVTGAGATRWCRLRTQRADPLVCAVGMLGSAIFICLIFVAAKSSIVGAYVSVVGAGGWADLGLEMQLDSLDPLSPRGDSCPLATCLPASALSRGSGCPSVLQAQHEFSGQSTHSSRA